VNKQHKSNQETISRINTYLKKVKEYIAQDCQKIYNEIANSKVKLRQIKIELVANGKKANIFAGSLKKSEVHFVRGKMMDWLEVI